MRGKSLPIWGEYLLVLFGRGVNLRPPMKKLSLAVLLGLAMCAVMTGCNENKSDTPTPPPATNAPATPPSTNAP